MSGDSSGTPAEKATPAPPRKWAAGLLILAVLVLGFAGIGSRWRAAQADTEMRRQLLHVAHQAAATVDVELARKLTFTSNDMARPEFQRLGEHLRRFQAATGVRSIYTLAIRGDQMVFGPESLAGDDPLASQPGTIYRLPPAQLADLFRNRSAWTTGPYTDEYGRFISAFVPVLEPRTGELVLTVGVDATADAWEARIHAETISPWQAGGIVSAMLVAGWWLMRRREQQSQPSGWLFHLETALTALMGLAITTLLATEAYRHEHRERGELFVRQAEEKARMLRQVVISLGENLGHLERFCRLRTPLTREDFRALAEPVLRMAPIQALEWVPCVAASGKTSHESRLSHEGFPGFAIYERNPEGGNNPVAHRPEYFPVSYVEPLTGNELAVGYDLGSDPLRRRALQEARRTGLATATEPLRLVQDARGDRGVLAFQPYSQTGNDTAGHGFVLGVLNMQRVLERALNLSSRKGNEAEVWLHDWTGPGGPRLLAEFTAQAPAAQGRDRPAQGLGPGNLLAMYPLFVFGRTWIMAAEPMPEFFAAHPLTLWWPIAVGGALATTALTSLVAALRNGQRALARRVLDHTRELQESRERLHMALEGAEEGVWDWDLVTGEILLNDRGARMLKYDPAEVRQLLFWKDLIHPDDHGEVRARLHSHLEGKSPRFQSEHRVRTRSGEWRWILDEGKVVRRDKQDHALRMVGTHKNIHERKLLELELRKLSKAIEHANCTVVITDRVGNIEYVNPRFTLTTGYAPEEARGKNPRILKSGEMPPAGYQQLWQTILAGQEWHGEFHNRRKDGTLYWELAAIAPILDPAGQITHFVAIKEDITARKLAETQLQENARLLEARNKAIEEAHRILAQLTDQLENRVRERTAEVERLLTQKEEFIQQLGHDLKTPLTPLIALLPLAREQTPEGKVREMLDLCIRNSQHMHRLVEQALDLCRLSASNAVALREDVPLAKVAAQAIADGARQIKRKEAKVTSHIPEDLVVRADARRLQQVLVRLLDNAEKFSPPETPVVVEARRHEREVCVSVSDRGIGMTPEQLTRAFDEFYKADASRTDRTGTGLGLSICRRIIELHGGHIWAESPGLGQGTTFYFTLPIATTLDKPNQKATTA